MGRFERFPSPIGNWEATYQRGNAIELKQLNGAHDEGQGAKKGHHSHPTSSGRDDIFPLVPAK